MLSVPSWVGYRTTSPSRTSSRSIAAIVPATRGSVAAKNPTTGISSKLASMTGEPYDCVKLPSTGSYPRAQTSRWGGLGIADRRVHVRGVISMSKTVDRHRDR
jgi:hypothetical protein